MLLAAVLLTSCVFKNEMAYPRMFAEITTFKVEGEAVPTTIDKRKMTVTVVLDEQQDLRKVKVLDYAFANVDKAPELPEILDLSTPLTLELANYHIYRWTIVGEQPVERFIDCKGAAEIRWMPESHQAQVLLLRTTDLKQVEINDMKLGLEDSQVISTTSIGADHLPHTEECVFPMTLDCSYERKFQVEYKGETTEWTVIFEHMQIEPAVTHVLPWCWHADVEAEFDGIGDVQVEYRKKGSTKWTAVQEVKVNGTKISADIRDLKPAHEYEVRLVQGESISEVKAFKTGKPEQLANMGFEDWTKTGKIWFPYQPEKRIWGSANPGVAAVSENTTTPEYNIKTEGNASVKMITGSAFGILAAGNLFTGQFGHLQGTTAHLYWGTPFTSRPSKLTGFYKYIPSTITGAKETLSGAGGIKNPYYDMNGKMDCMQIMVALIAEGTEVIKDINGNVINSAYRVISSKPGNPQLNPEKPGHDPRVIAFGEIITDKTSLDGFEAFELPLKYYDDREPAYVIVIACSSAYGNFFTGAIGSQLYVDDFKFVYE